MIPNQPGRWAFHHFAGGGRISIFWIEWRDYTFTHFSETVLEIIWEDRWSARVPYANRGPVLAYTQLMEEMGWGEWLERVSDLPVLIPPPGQGLPVEPSERTKRRLRPSSASPHPLRAP